MMTIRAYFLAALAPALLWPAGVASGVYLVALRAPWSRMQVEKIVLVK